MKKIVKIFMTVAAGMMAFSCATDTTDDLGVNLGKGQKTVISASLEESRTQLGGYDEVNEKYPMYWSEGDKISVNGVESESAVISEANGAVASFTVSGVEKPFCIAYPAAPEGQVLFAENQTHTAGTFGDGVSTMYGYGEEGANVTLNHLTGILKIGIVGSEEITLTHAQISTVDRKPIAGTFDFAFETDAEGNKVPKLTPTADAKSVINYSFGTLVWEGDECVGGGQTLSTDSNYPTYIHVAVPAGIYDELYVTLYDIDGGVMYATVKADDNKPLVAGTVREFKKNDAEQFIEYVPLANDVTVIKNYDDLVKFNKAAASATKVVLANDITILDGTNDTAWTSIENFAGEFYGNGYAIKGLTAPLFGTTTASVIKGVHLEDVDITSGAADVAALACVINNENATVTNCSVEGEITVNGNNPVAVNDKVLHYASLVGFSTSKQKFSDLYTNVEYKITGVFNVKMRAANTISHIKGSLEDVVNHGTLTFDATSTKELQFGGITYYCELGHTNCTNGSVEDATGSKGAITINGDPQHEVNVAGAIYYQSLIVDNCHNYGNIDINVNKSTTIYVGGVSRLAKSATQSKTINITKCSNHGNITVSGTTDICYIAGIVPEDEGSKYPFHIKNCSNHGNITLEEGFKSTTNAYIGGIVGVRDNSCTTTIESTENHGTITFDGSVDTSIWAGGIVGTVLSSNDSTPVLVLKACTNRGPLSINGSATDYVRVGGILGATSLALSSDSSGDIVNYAKISCSTTNTDGTTRVSGWCGSTGTKFKFEQMKLFNYGDVECSATGTVKVSGIAYSTSHIDNATCFCNIEAKEEADVAMITANTRDANRIATNCNIGGKINGEGITEENFYNYIYAAPITATQAETDGCTYWDGK